MEKELLSKVLDLCYEISTTTKADVFFSYAPHVNNILIDYHKDGWGKNKPREYIAYLKTINKENLEDTIQKLEELKKEVAQ